MAETSPGTRIARTRGPGDSAGGRHGHDRNGKAVGGAGLSRGTGTRLTGLLHHGASEVGLIVQVLDVSVELPATALHPASPVSLTWAGQFGSAGGHGRAGRHERFLMISRLE